MDCPGEMRIYGECPECGSDHIWYEEMDDIFICDECGSEEWDW
jgi:predicted RNA-binding Zn-ribbon protein involved in translation (DUF1610 family)